MVLRASVVSTGWLSRHGAFDSLRGARCCVVHLRCVASCTTEYVHGGWAQTLLRGPTREEKTTTISQPYAAVTNHSYPVCIRLQSLCVLVTLQA